MMSPTTAQDPSAQAAAARPTPSSAAIIPHYLIEIDSALYAIPQREDGSVCWVQRPRPPTHLPTLPPWCLGLVNQRNVPVLLIDPRDLLGLAPMTQGPTLARSRHVFVQWEGETLGLLVDATYRFGMLASPPAPPEGPVIAGTATIDGRPVQILNLPAVWRVFVERLGAPSMSRARQP